MKAASLWTLFVVVTLVLGHVGPANVAHAQARTADWTVSYTYQNAGFGPTRVVLAFFEEGSPDPILFNPLGPTGTLAAGAGASFFIGSVNGLSSNFRGSAVITSYEPLAATAVHFSQYPGFKMRLLSNAFSADDVNSAQYLLVTTLANKYSRTTAFSIKNVEASPIRATIKFYDADNGGVLAGQITHVIPANTNKWIDVDNPAQTGLPTATFNGSASISGVLDSDGTTPALLVAAALEMYTNKNVATAFEGVPLNRAANMVYLATALCGTNGLDTFYAVQNASVTTSATINVTYYATNGSLIASDGSYTIGPGAKKSITTCSVTSAGFTGSAKITSTGAPIVVMGKAQHCSAAPCDQNNPGTLDVFTSFLGEPFGTSRLALPFIRWANEGNFNNPNNVGGKQRAYLAIMNLEPTPAVVNVKYYDKVGALVATHQLTIAGLAKGQSNPSTALALDPNTGEFGYYSDGTTGGAVIIEADAANPNARFIAIARVQHPGTGEDYNAVPVP